MKKEVVMHLSESIGELRIEIEAKKDANKVELVIYDEGRISGMTNLSIVGLSAVGRFLTKASQEIEEFNSNG